MTYSYTQISQYLTCPRKYRHRYLDGWQEKDTRAAMLFGRAFEQAVAALFRREDPAAVLFEQWSVCKDMGLTYSGNDTWDRMLQQGIQLLERFAQDGRVRIRRPRSTQQIQFTRTLSSGNNFVSYVDAIGELDGTPCVLEWKTSSARYPEEPAGISALDPQLVCYSWMTGIDEVAQIVFVRKRLVEVQYLRATISDEQRQEFATLVDDTVRRIESGLFLPQSGIRFPQNPCTTCPFIGLCLDKPDLVETALVRKPGVDLGLFDELFYRYADAAQAQSQACSLCPHQDRRDPGVGKAERRGARHALCRSGRYLCEVRAGQYWRLENLKSFDEFLQRRFPDSRRTAYYLMSIHEHLPPQIRRELKQVGWTKAAELTKVARSDGKNFDCAAWMHKSPFLTRDQFKREVDQHLTGKDTEPTEIIYFKFYQSQIPVIEQAIETAALMLGTDKSRGYCLEMICAELCRGEPGQRRPRDLAPRSHASSSSCPANSGRLSSKTCVRKRRDRLTCQDAPTG